MQICLYLKCMAYVLKQESVYVHIQNKLRKQRETSKKSRIFLIYLN